MLNLLSDGPSAFTIAASTTQTLSGIVAAVAGAALAMLAVLTGVAVMTQTRWPAFRLPLFILMTLVVATSTLAMSGIAIFVDVRSPTHGPVQWAADFQVWACGNHLQLRQPQNLLTNRLGTPTLYAQDGQIHFTGTPLDQTDDASLGALMQAIGGQISDDSLLVPLDNTDGFTGQPASPEQVKPYLATRADGTYFQAAGGQQCDDAAAFVQAFAYHFDTTSKTYRQTKLAHPADYAMAPAAQVPPGDCIVVEFAPPEDYTNRLCPSYGQRDYDRCTEFGVPADKIVSCDIREIRP